MLVFLLLALELWAWQCARAAAAAARREDAREGAPALYLRGRQEEELQQRRREASELTRRRNDAVAALEAAACEVAACEKQWRAAKSAARRPSLIANNVILGLSDVATQATELSKKMSAIMSGGGGGGDGDNGTLRTRSAQDAHLSSLGKSSTRRAREGCF